MRKTITKTILITLILITSIVFVMPTAHTYAESPSGAGVDTGEISNAPGILSKFLAFASLPDLLNSAAANIVNNIAIPIAGTILSASAYILDVSIRLTLNIKSFVDATPVIYSVWKILRDITGLFFIFYLIYAAIQMMTGLGQGPSYGSTIKTIVIAGILINFSFFIVSVTIDFSNILSQTIYHAMVPNTRIMSIDSNTGISKIVSEAGKSDISNIFMNSLRIQNIYDTNGNKFGTQITNPIKILIIGTAGVIMMLTTAASFIFAALAFVARLVILLFLLTFSSLWFVASVIPQIKKHLNFWGYLWDQLIFMPVYLLLMYVGLTILNGSNLLLDVNGSINSAPTGTNWLMPYMILAVNFTIVIIILNLPLVVGLSMGGMATGWLKSSIGKWDATKVWKNFGGGISGVIGTNTVGRLSSTLDKNLANTKAGNSLVGRAIRSNTVGSLAANKYGGSKTWDDKSKATKERIAKGAEIDRSNKFRLELKNIRSGNITPAGIDTIKKSLKEMSPKERLALGIKDLKDPNIVKYLSAKDFSAINDEKDGVFSEQDKKDISEARYAALEKAVVDGEKDTIKHMIGTMDGKDLLKANDKILLNEEAIKNMKISQLKTMEEEGLDSAKKAVIKSAIQVQAITGGHSAFGWVNKNWSTTS